MSDEFGSDQGDYGDEEFQSMLSSADQAEAVPTGEGTAAEFDQQAAYDRLQRVGEGLEDREFMRGARLPFMRTRELVQSQEAVDDAGDRVWDAVRDARATGMDWTTIAKALKLPEQDVIDRYRQVDGM
jgi:hypothetical protein